MPINVGVILADAFRKGFDAISTGVSLAHTIVSQI
jgi:hypothetical protein